MKRFPPQKQNQAKEDERSRDVTGTMAVWVRLALQIHVRLNASQDVAGKERGAPRTHTHARTPSVNIQSVPMVYFALPQIAVKPPRSLHTHPQTRAALLPRGSWLAWISPPDSAAHTLSHTLLSSGGGGVRRFTALAPGLVEMGGPLPLSPHQLAVNVPCFVLPFQGSP